MTAKRRILLVSIVPPRNDCGVRIVMHRMLVERSPFELHVASKADVVENSLVHTPLRLPWLINRIRKSRFGPGLASWITDYENFVWPLTNDAALQSAVEDFKPDVILTLAEGGFSHIARKTAEKHRLPLVGLFLDWFPVMKGHCGHAAAIPTLNRRFRELYAACDLAFCTSQGMQEALGAHPNSHVLYPMPGKHRVPDESWPRSTGKFRLVYVGSVQDFYGRMLCALIQQMEATQDCEIVVVGPNADWPRQFLERAKSNGSYLGFKTPDESDDVIASADAVLVVMSFEREHELFMGTSFTTKFLDYVAFGKPVILWGPDYCTAMRVARENGGALMVNDDDPGAVVSACRRLAKDAALRKQLSQEATRLHQTLFNPDRLQATFEQEIEKLIRTRGGHG
jgi:glycosyltransferase involved in cell wall biosynthesis